MAKLSYLTALVLLALLPAACGPKPDAATPAWSWPTETSYPTQPQPETQQPAATTTTVPSPPPPDVSAGPTPPSPPPVDPIPDYDRDEWHHWIDADGDCQDTRQEVLIQESEIPVTFKTEKHCKVATGRWTCPYTGRVFTDPGQLDIDHMVPLQNAHVSGGWQWQAAKKEGYANDLDDAEHLIAVYRGAKRSKGSKGPEEWMPPNEADRCEYVANWQAIKIRWGLEMNEAEAAFVIPEARACGF